MAGIVMPSKTVPLAEGIWAPRLAAAEQPWYLAGGAPTPIAVWQPKAGNGWNPTSLAESYVNRVNPGIYDAFPGVAPTWDAVNGWLGDGATTYLHTGLMPASADCSLVVRLGSFAGSYDSPVGFIDPISGAGTTMGFSILSITMNNTGELFLAPHNWPLPVTFTIAGQSGYQDGAYLGNMSIVACTAYELYLLARNSGGSAAMYYTGHVRAIGYWDTTLSEAQVLDIHNALVAAGL